MKKVILILIFIINSYFLLSQQIEEQGLGFAQMIGGGPGFTIGYEHKASANFDLNYFASLDHFGIKIKTSLEPYSDFGLKYKWFISPGFTTKLKNKVSFHLLIGLGAIYSSKESNLSKSIYYPNAEPTLMINSGLYFNTFKNKNIYFGFDSYWWKEYLIPSQIHTPNYNFNPITFCISINYLILKNK